MTLYEYAARIVRVVDGDLRGRLAEVLHNETNCWADLGPNDGCWLLADALLPVVEAAVREARAEELEAAASELHLNISGRQGLRDRAAAIREQP